MGKTFDIIIIGGGPAGYVAAIRASQLGLSVACVDDRPYLGGTCLNVGCIPSKALLKSSEHYEVLSKHGKEHGILCDKLSFDLQQMMKRKQGVVETLGMGIAGLFKKNKVSYFQGKGKLLANKTVEVIEHKDKQVITGKSIILAMGSSPIELPFLPFDEKKVLSSTGALSLQKVPETLLVIGAGVIGLELASVYARLGTKVEVVEMMKHACPGMDTDITKVLTQTLVKDLGMNFHFESAVKAASLGKKDLTLKVEKGKKSFELKGDVVLVGVGRRPNTHEAGVKDLGIQLDDRGFILVNGQFETSMSGVYAIGDLIEGPMLAHKASEEGVVCVDHLAGKNTHINYMGIPGVVYTYPEVACVGLTEEEAKAAGLKIKKGSFPFKANSRARATGEDKGLVKILAEEQSMRLLGMHIIAANASEIIGEGVMAIEKKATIFDIAYASHAHPTYTEAIKEAALATIDKPIHL